MPLDKSKLFSIGDVAGLFNLSTGTLRHYETLGLITPEYTDPDTGYRYYSVRQFEPLNTVRYLCMLNMPLGSIGDFLQNRDVDVIEQKLRRQKEEILEKQRELAVIERKINSRLRMISDARSSPLDVIEVKMLPPCRLVWVEKPLSIDDSLDMELPIRRLDSAQDTAVFLGKVGVGISRENLRPRKIRHRDQHPDNREIEKDRIRLDAVLNFVILNYLMPYFLLNLSTRPLVSTSFCLPV